MMTLPKGVLAMKNHRWSALVASILMLAFLAACGGGGGGGEQAEQADTGPKIADLVYVNWAEGVAYTNLAKVILEDKMGYEVTITAADVAPAYAAVAQGDKDAFMETWLPVLHKDYVDRYEGQVVDLGHVYEGTQSGLVVPQYVTIDKISELNDHADKFDGEIVGIDAGAGVMKTTEKVIDEYSLDLELISSSGPAMTAALKKAVGANDWIVVTGWRPHWMFGRWDLKFLEQDADKMMWQSGNIHIMGRKNLEQDKPELAAFLRNYFFTDAQLSDLMIAMRESEDQEAAAREWMNANPDVVETWIP
jgi:glycine betaine/proline transport system substrate-binding protein